MTSFKTELKWGVIFSLVTLVWFYLLAILGYTSTKIALFPTADMLFTIVTIILFIMALRSKRKTLNNKITWLQGFTSAMAITLVILILSVPGQYIAHTYIIPEFFPNSINYAIDNNLMTKVDAENYFNLTNYMKQSVLFSIITGILVGAVTSFLMRRK